MEGEREMRSGAGGEEKCSDVIAISVSERRVHLNFGSVQCSTISYRGRKTVGSDTASVIISCAHQLVCHSPTSTLCQVQHSDSPADKGREKMRDSKMVKH